MDRPHPSSSIIRFGVFEADLQAGELLRAGLRVRIQDKSFQLLAALLERPGELVTREELRQRLWPGDTFVDFDNGLNAVASKLRDVLGDSAANPRFVQTLPRRGYRFIAPVARVPEAADGPREPKSARRVGWSRTAAALAAVAGMSLTAVLVWALLQQHPTIGSGRTMLAVLPFENLTGDPEQEYLAGGLTEEVITRLGRLNPERMGVIARTTVMMYKVGHKPIEQIGEELGVGYVVEGSIRKGRDRVRVIVQLVEVADQSQVWAESYDHDLTGMLKLQSELAQRVASSLGGEILAADQPPPSPSEPLNAEAYEAYLKGRYFRELMTEDGFRKGMKYFQRAVELEPAYANAYAGMAGCYCLLGGHGLELEPPHEIMPKAKDAVQKALSLDETQAEAHAILGMIRLKYDWDWVGSKAAFDRAIELNPSYAQAHLWNSLYFEVMGRGEEAIESARRALALDPLSLRTNVNLAAQFYQARRYPEAIAQIQQTLELEPNFWVAHWCLGDAYERMGRYSEALTALEEARKLSQSNPAVLASLGYTYAVSHQKEEAQAVIEKLETMGRERYVSPYTLATVYSGLGQSEKTFLWLERGYQQRSRSMIWLKVDARFDPLRSEPFLESLVRRIGLPQ